MKQLKTYNLRLVNFNKFTEQDAIVLLKNKNGKNKMGIVPCSNTIFSILIQIPSKPGTFMLCEELILHFEEKNNSAD